MTEEMGLFNGEADLKADVDDLWARAGSGVTLPSLLSNQIAKLPDSIQTAAREVQAHLLRDAFERLASALLRAEAAGGPAPRANLVMHSAAMETFSRCSTLEYFPWHLVKGDDMVALADSIQASASLAPLEAHGRKVKAANLFVAGQPKEDRDTYLRGVKAILEAHPVYRLVLDSEKVDMTTPTQFDSVAKELGIGAFFISMCSREESQLHSDLSDRVGRPVISCDTSGKRMKPANVTRSTVPDRSMAFSNSDPEIESPPAYADGQSSRSGSGPMTDRLQQIRARQSVARRPASARPA